MGTEEIQTRSWRNVVLGSGIEAAVQGRQSHPAMFAIVTNIQTNGRMTVNDEFRVHQAVIAPWATDVDWEYRLVFAGPHLFKTGRYPVQQLAHS